MEQTPVPGPSPMMLCALFGELEADACAELSAITRVARYRAGDVIFRQGDPGTSMVVVLRGRVRISTTSAEGKGLILAVLDPGQVLGEIALFEGGVRSADAIAEEPTELMVLERRDLIPFLERHPRTAIALLEILARRLRRTVESLGDRSFLSLQGRLAKVLLQLCAAYGHETVEGTRIDLKLSQRVLGEMLGASRESVNKQLQAWSAEGLLRLERGHVVLIDRDALEGILGLQ